VELVTTIDDCKHILEDLHILLAKYDGLSTTGDAVSAPKKLWHQLRFSTKIEQLGDVREKLIQYTSTISVLLDTVQLRATGRVEDKLDNVSSQMAEGFESLKRAILGMAVKARAEQRGGSTMSVLSLSTYAGDDKEVWQEFRRELVARGFRSKALDRHKDLLQAYMLKLDQSGVLDEVKSSSGQEIVQPWWKKHAFVETVNSLPGPQPIDEEQPVVPLYQPEADNQSSPPPPEYSINDANKDSLISKLPPGGVQTPYDPELHRMPRLRPLKETDIPGPKEKSPVASPDVARTSLPWPTDSEESEKETTGPKRPRRVRTKRKPEYKALNADPVGVVADIVTETASDVPRSSPMDIDGNERNLKAKGSIPMHPVQVAPNIIAEVPLKAPQKLMNEKDEYKESTTIEKLSSRSVGVQNSGIPSLHTARISIDPRSGKLNGDPFLSTSTNDQTEHSSTSTKLQPAQIVVLVNPQPASVAAESKDAVQTSLPDGTSYQNLQAGDTLLALGSQDPVQVEQARASNKVTQNLHQHPSRLASEADIPGVRHDESRNVGEVATASRDPNRRANRREEAARDPRDKNVVEQFLRRLEDPSSNSTQGRDKKYHTIPGINDSTGRTQSPKSKRATAGAAPARPALNQTQSGPVPRIRTEHRAQIQERSKVSAGKSSSTSNLNAVVMGLAGLSAILGLPILGLPKRRAQARGRRGYISDSYDIYSYDSYSGTLTSDSEDDGNLPRNAKKEPVAHVNVEERVSMSGGLRKV
jgi:hypothetical protein